MKTSDLLLDEFNRVAELGRSTVKGLTADQLAERPQGVGNPIAWLLWHLTRVQDAQVAAAFDREQVWTEQGWVGRLGLPLDRHDTGFGHTPEQVASVRVQGGGLLADHLDAVTERTRSLVSALTDDDLDRVVDERWDPPVTLGVRLNSVIGDDLQHLGQAAYVRGLVTG